MRVSPAGAALIRHFEGFSPVAYRCPAGLLTIGYGHVLAADESLRVIDKAAAEILLRNDLVAVEASIRRLIRRSLSSTQFDALASFTFNLGAGALQRSRLRRLVNRRTDEAVPRELMRWVHGGGRILPGLIARRQAEARLYQGMPAFI